MGEYLLRKRLGPDTTWKVASAGTSAIDGFGATGCAVDAVAEQGIAMGGHRSRPLSAGLVDSCDVILGMTRMHVDEILARYPQARDKVFLLTSFRESARSTDVRSNLGVCCQLIGGSGEVLWVLGIDNDCARSLENVGCLASHGTEDRFSNRHVFEHLERRYVEVGIGNQRHVECCHVGGDVRVRNRPQAGHGLFIAILCDPGFEARRFLATADGHES